MLQNIVKRIGGRHTALPIKSPLLLLGLNVVLRRNHHVTVIGAGIMGSGIAQVTAQGGHQVTLVDLTNDQLQKGLKGIDKSLSTIASKSIKNETEAVEFKNRILQNIKVTVDLKKAVEDADLVIEGVVEKLDVKQKLFQSLDGMAPAKTIFVSNTSSLSIAHIATSTSRLDRFAGLHFFNPVPLMRLVEIVKTPQSSESVITFLQDYVKSIGKTGILCTDTPGFVVNRLLVPYLLESYAMFERGVASKEDIDIAMKLGTGYPMGPFELSDFSGLDTIKYVLDGWHKEYPDLFKPSALLDKLVAEGKYGRKTGEGFYKYNTTPKS